MVRKNRIIWYMFLIKAKIKTNDLNFLNSISFYVSNIIFIHNIKFVLHSNMIKSCIYFINPIYMAADFTKRGSGSYNSHKYNIVVCLKSNIMKRDTVEKNQFPCLGIEAVD